jgi:predicted SprT family Zn-dependent metalloprotease
MQTIKCLLAAICRIAMLLLCLIAWSSQAGADEVKDVYAWVAEEMDISTIPPLPRIRFVDKDDLRAAFEQSNHPSFIRWQAQYGQPRARQIMNRYLQDIVGLFVAHSNTVYVYALLPPCRRRAILAHELCHYFQYVTKGKINPDRYDADILHMLREMEAYKLEKKYQDGHCLDYQNVVF